jgi:hypothetical protein
MQFGSKNLKIFLSVLASKKKENLAPESEILILADPENSYIVFFSKFFDFFPVEI